jgi:hypothetical protein
MYPALGQSFNPLHIELFLFDELWFEPSDGS